MWVYDGPSATQFEKILPGFEGSLQSQDTARKYYKRRQGGGLRPVDIELLARYYRSAYSEKIPQEKWRVQTADALLSKTTLNFALQATRERVRLEIGILINVESSSVLSNPKTRHPCNFRSDWRFDIDGF